MNNSNLNKTLYKVFLIILKYTPIFLAFIQSLNILTNFLNLEITVLTAIGGISFPFILLLFIMSFVFKFCYLYRMPLVYVTALWLISIIDSFIGIPIDTLNMFRVYAFIFGVFIITYVIFIYKNRNKPKVDYIKQMCENYSKCCN